MSIEIFVWSDRRLGSIEEWQQAIDREGVPLRLSTEGTFDALQGFLPATWGEHETGFECDHFDADEFTDDMEEFGSGRQWKQVLAFRWGGDFGAAVSAFAAAGAYARATDGVVFDGEAGEVVTPDQALQTAREMAKEYLAT
jgi:hypothetical protein